MKLLFIPSLRVDGLEDVIYAGLNSIPNISLHEFRFKPTYHNEYPNIKYALGISELTPHWIRQSGKQSNKVYSTTDEIDFDQFDYIILGSLREDVLPFLPTILKSSGSRLVYLDGEDDPFIRFIKMRIAIYFKREKLSDMRSFFNGVNKQNITSAYSFQKSKISNLFYSALLPQIPPIKNSIVALNMSVIKHSFPKIDDFDIDVSLVARPTNKLRVRFINALSKIAKKHGLKVYLNTTGVNHLQYREMLLRSRVCISLPGAGFDTFRYWEIPFYERCLLSFKLPIEIPNNFEDGYSAIFFKSEEELEDKILKTLNSGAYDDLRKNGKQDFLLYHTDVKRAERVLHCMNQKNI